MQPVIIEDRISIAANTTNDNVIVSNASLRRYLRAPFPAQGKLVAIQSAAGLLISMDYGSKNVVADSQLRVGTDMQEPNDVVNDQWFPREGDQLVLRCSNTTGGALFLSYRIVLFPWDGQSAFPPLPDARVMQRGPVSIPDNSVDFQLLDGLRYERPPVPSILEVLMTASAAGLTRELYVDTGSIAPASAIPPLNRVPLDPFDKTIEGVEVPEDKLIQLSITNRSGGALSVFWKTILQELMIT